MGQILKFPENFLWGTATSSYQIEGGIHEDGRVESIWDRFSHVPGKIYQNQNGDVACDHYHRYEEDVKLMAQLGLKAYRFSLAWPRILPDGKTYNQKGIDFYKRLIEQLLQNKIEPFVTLYHWDLPQTLEEKNGWINKDTSKYFADYAEIVAKELQDYAKYFFTFNEMMYIVQLGYKEGHHAPGRRENQKTVNQVKHNLLLAHGMGINAIKSVNTKLKAGIVHAIDSVLPADNDPETIQSVKKLFHQKNTVIFDTIFYGKYTQEALQQFGNDAPDYTEDELKIIGTPIDIFGLNLYSGTPIRLTPTKECEPVPYPDKAPRTYYGWTIVPESMYWAVRYIQELYPIKEFYITENGASFNDQVTPTGRVIDNNRIDYLKNYLIYLYKAIKEGYKVNGYFVWSLIDNFEWAEGYKHRFGLIYIDYENNQKRIIKESGYWYKKVIMNNGIEI